MTNARGRREAEGDAACVWHCLDAVLLKTREARDTLEENGLDGLAEEFRTVVDVLEEAYAEAEDELAKVF